MPTNFGVLPDNQRFPNGKVQIKRGGADAGVNEAGSGVSIKLTDSAGGYMQIAYTPTYPCYWVVKSNIMAHGLNDGTGWRRWDHAIMINPADADGVTNGFQCPQQIYDYTSVEWRSCGGSACFRLNPGVSYLAYLAYMSTTAGTVTFHTGPQWCRIVGRIVGEGVL